jgi:hypothetical protein
METLYSLGALDEEGLLTRLGRRMAEFPLDPTHSKVRALSLSLSLSIYIYIYIVSTSISLSLYPSLPLSLSSSLFLSRACGVRNGRFLPRSHALQVARLWSLSLSPFPSLLPPSLSLVNPRRGFKLRSSLPWT